MRVLAIILLLSLPAHAARVISLSPSITEIIFALNEGPQLVGVSKYSDYPESAKTLPSVGDYTNPSLEKILSLKPDLVLLAEEGVDTITPRLEAAKIHWRSYKMRRLDDYVSSVRQIAETIKAKTDQTTALIKSWTDTMALLGTKASRIGSVLIQVDLEPLIIAGGDNFLSDIVTKCGSKNVFSNLNGYPRINLEAVVKNKPDAIVSVIHTDAHVEEKRLRHFWKNRNVNVPVFIYDPDLFARLGPRLPKAAELLCKGLQE